MKEILLHRMTRLMPDQLIIMSMMRCSNTIYIYIYIARVRSCSTEALAVKIHEGEREVKLHCCRFL